MYKVTIIITSMVVMLISSSCNRRHQCTCDVTGASTSSYTKEYRGYSAKEANQLCKSEEFASNATTEIRCRLW